MILTAIMTRISSIYKSINNLIHGKNLNPSNSTYINETVLTTVPDTIFSSEATFPTLPETIILETTISTKTSSPLPQPSTTEIIVQNQVIYYPACDNSFTSLVDALKSIGVDSSMTNRKVIAQMNNITDYTGTSQQNLELLSKLKQGILIKSFSSTTSSTIELPTETTKIYKTNEIIDQTTEINDEINDKIKYFPKCDESIQSITKGLENICSFKSMKYRKKIAEVNDIKNYEGTTEQNMELLNKLKKGLLIKPLNILEPFQNKLTELEINNIKEKLKNSKEYENKDKDKSYTLAVIGEGLLKYGYYPSFVAGVLGNIYYEGNIGLLENSYYSDESKIPTYLKNMNNKYDYKNKYSKKYIYNLSLLEIRNILEELRKTKFYLNKQKIGFGMGCAQWTFNRTYNLLQFYLDENGEKDKINLEQTCEAEKKMLLSELNYEDEYLNIYNNWEKEQEKNKIDLDSENAAGNAGVLFCKEFEKPLDINERAKQRDAIARKIYKIMMK